MERKIKINGEYPHKEAESLVFNRLYRDDPDGKGKTDVQGNDIRPSQLEVKQWQDDGFYPRFPGVLHNTAAFLL